MFDLDPYIVEKDMFIYVHRFKQGKKILIPLNIIGMKIKLVVFAPFLNESKIEEKI